MTLVRLLLSWRIFFSPHSFPFQSRLIYNLVFPHKTGSWLMEKTLFQLVCALVSL